MKTYRFIGNPYLIPGSDPPPRVEVSDQPALRGFLLAEGEVEGFDLEGCVTVTYIVDLAKRFWISSRRSEHVACARGEPVLAAGEASFTLEGGSPEIMYLTNQSTGYCPEPGCWEAVVAALAESGLEFPPGFEHAFDFRRCENCGTLTVLKDDYQDTCLECGTPLPDHWNFDAE